MGRVTLMAPALERAGFLHGSGCRCPESFPMPASRRGPRSGRAGGAQPARNVVLVRKAKDATPVARCRVQVSGQDEELAGAGGDVVAIIGEGRGWLLLSRHRTSQFARRWTTTPTQSPYRQTALSPHPFAGDSTWIAYQTDRGGGRRVSGWCILAAPGAPRPIGRQRSCWCTRLLHLWFAGPTDHSTT
jgi:hypothetical protein